MNEIVHTALVRHLAERLQDDGTLHTLTSRRRDTCAYCEHVKALPIAEQLRLAVEARASL